MDVLQYPFEFIFQDRHYKTMVQEFKAIGKHYVRVCLEPEKIGPRILLYERHPELNLPLFWYPDESKKDILKYVADLILLNDAFKDEENKK